MHPDVMSVTTSSNPVTSSKFSEQQLTSQVQQLTNKVITESLISLENEEINSNNTMDRKAENLTSDVKQSRNGSTNNITAAAPPPVVVKVDVDSTSDDSRAETNKKPPATASIAHTIKLPAVSDQSRASFLPIHEVVCIRRCYADG